MLQGVETTENTCDMGGAGPPARSASAHPSSLGATCARIPARSACRTCSSSSGHAGSPPRCGGSRHQEHASPISRCRTSAVPSSWKRPFSRYAGMWSKRSSGRGSSAQTHLSSLRGFLQPGHISRSAWVATIRKLTKSAVLATSMLDLIQGLGLDARLRDVQAGDGQDPISACWARFSMTAVRYWKTGIWSACTIDSPRNLAFGAEQTRHQSASSSSSLPSFLPLAARKKVRVKVLRCNGGKGCWNWKKPAGTKHK